MERMLVTQALNELKTLDARIYRTISASSFVATAKTSEKKVTPNLTKDEFNIRAKADFQSANDLISRREKIKAAVVDSNAKTEVEICGEKYTVAKVIDMKNSIEYKKKLLDKMKTQLLGAESMMNKNNTLMEQKIDQLVTAAYSKESKTTIKPEEYSSIADPYRASNEFSLVDPLNIREEIESLQKYIEEFEANVDSVLQISNCVTYIEF